MRDAERSLARQLVSRAGRMVGSFVVSSIDAVGLGWAGLGWAGQAGKEAGSVPGWLAGWLAGLRACGQASKRTGGRLCCRVKSISSSSSVLCSSSFLHMLVALLRVVADAGRGSGWKIHARYF